MDGGKGTKQQSRWFVLACLFLTLLVSPRFVDAYRVHHGDTLWDISERFLQNPFLWPKVWALNPHLENPHWIYPGDRLRLKSQKTPRVKKTSPKNPRPLVQAPASAMQPSPEKVQTKVPPPALPLYTFENIRAAGFIAESKLEEVGRVLTNGDDTPLNVEPRILCFYAEEGEKILPGDRFTTFTYVKTVDRPGSYFGKLGDLVQLGGDIEVVRVKGRFCFAKILHSYEEIAEGDPIGRFPRWPSRLVITPFKKPLDARIVMMKDGLMMGAQDRVVYIDKGKEDGLSPGNKLHVYKRCPPKRNPYIPSYLPACKMELPERRIGSLVILSTRSHTATAVIYTVRMEIDVGDRVGP